jgi:hypothetical protein
MAVRRRFHTVFYWWVLITLPSSREAGVLQSSPHEQTRVQPNETPHTRPRPALVLSLLPGDFKPSHRASASAPKLAHTLRPHTRSHTRPHTRPRRLPRPFPTPGGLYTLTPSLRLRLNNPPSPPT